MKTLLILGLIFVMVFSMFAMVSPASAAGVGSTSSPDGEPPGWSHVNPGGGGSDSPGPGNPRGN